MHVVADRWYAVLPSAEVPAGRPHGARVFGLDLVFWRDDAGIVHAGSDRCPHRHAALSLGTVKDGCVECPFHGFLFDRDGACTHIPAHPDRRIGPSMSMPMLHVREAHDLIWAWTGAQAPPADPIPFFDFSGHSWAGSAKSVEWDVHYTRSVENQLDFPHLPFVHATTIGRFVESEAMEVVTELEGDHLRAWVAGQDAGFIEFIGPNIWRLRTGPKVLQFLAFVPVDDTSMRYLTRTYQGMVTVPGVDWLLGAISRLANRFVLDQDRRVVESQPRGEVRLRMDERLIPADGPILAYRRWREDKRVDAETLLQRRVRPNQQRPPTSPPSDGADEAA